MSDILCKMINLAKEVGAVDCAHMYDNRFLTIEGKTKDGNSFSLNLHIKEEEENA